MPLYLCIALAKSSPIEVRPIEADGLDQAVQKALELCRKHATCTRFEVWQGGVKIHTGEPVKLE